MPRYGIDTVGTWHANGQDTDFMRFILFYFIKGCINRFFWQNWARFNLFGKTGLMEKACL